MVKEIKLIDNTLNKSEAKFLLSDLIDTKLNFHKLRRLQATEGDQNADTEFDDQRIKELEKAKRTLHETLNPTGSFKVEAIIKIEEI